MTFKQVGAKDAHSLIENDGYVYVDIRSLPEFDAGHPKGAFNVPLMHMGAGGMEPNNDFLSVMQKAFTADQKIIIGCKAGGRSLKAAQLLSAAGFTNIVDQKGGFSGQTDPFGRVVERGWSTESLPCSTAPEAGHDYATLSRR
ncbi:MAG: rhodanese-like domain-containing protein [Sandaracinaceae bacterium]|jgi:rhodanese-related sulfurtransferase|nr:rhodanese-like domain-containing protein [Sandaracinaceae bacterium]